MELNQKQRGSSGGRRETRPRALLTYSRARERIIATVSRFARGPRIAVVALAANDRVAENDQALIGRNGLVQPSRILGGSVRVPNAGAGL